MRIKPIIVLLLVAACLSAFGAEPAPQSLLGQCVRQPESGAVASVQGFLEYAGVSREQFSRTFAVAGAP